MWRRVLRAALNREPSRAREARPHSRRRSRLWDTWVTWGGEGIVRRDLRAPSRPGERTQAWRKLKARVGGDVTSAQHAIALRSGKKV